MNNMNCQTLMSVNATLGSSANTTGATLPEGTKRKALLEWLRQLDPHASSLVDIPFSIAKLEALHSINQQADKTVNEVLLTMKKMESEFEALYKKKDSCVLNLDIDCNDMNSVINRTFLAVWDLIQNGDIGDGTDAGAIIELSDKIVEIVHLDNLKRNLKRNIKIIKQKNDNILKSIDFMENQLQTFTEQARNLELKTKDIPVQNSYLQAETKKLCESRLSIKEELDNLGVDPTISDQCLLNDYNRLVEMETKIKEVRRRFKKEFEDLPPSISEALETIQKKKKELATVSASFKAMLMSAKNFTY